MPKPSDLSRLLILPSAQWDAERVVGHLGYSLNDPHLLLLTDEKSITIESIRDLQSLLTTNQEGRVVVIFPAEKITLPAQQALLKLLEEPPKGTTVVLAAFSRSAVAATLVSRCVVEVVQEEKRQMGEISLFARLEKASDIGDGVEIAQSLPAKRDELSTYLTDELRKARHEKPTLMSVRIQEKTLEVLEALRVNVSPALCAEAVCLEKWRKPHLSA